MIKSLFSIFKNDKDEGNLLKLFYSYKNSIIFTQYFTIGLVSFSIIYLFYTFKKIQKNTELNRQESIEYFIIINKKIMNLQQTYKYLDQKINFPHFYNDFIKKQDCVKLVENIINSHVIPFKNNNSDDNSFTTSDFLDESELVEIEI